MNKFGDETKNREFYQQTFHEIHASPELLRKVDNMRNTKGIHKIKKAARIGYALAAALAICFIFSNVITYAATGSSWMGKLIIHSLDGREEEMEIELQRITDEDGNDYYRGTVKADDATQETYITETETPAAD